MGSSTGPPAGAMQTHAMKLPVHSYCADVNGGLERCGNCVTLCDFNSDKGIYSI